MDTQHLSAILEHALGTSTEITSCSRIGGGCINYCYGISTIGTNYFLKINSVEFLKMFEAEFEGLQALKKSFPLKVPEPIAAGQIDNTSYILMEFIDSSVRDVDYWDSFAKGLADMHRTTGNHFGYEIDNYIGRLPQSNRKLQNWLEFLIQERYLPQVERGVESTIISQSTRLKFERLFSKLDRLLVIESPAFLHGDLWSGNLMVGSVGEPTLVDPAVHYGHREIELAFTTLFGGFDSRFYQVYKECYPLEPGYQDRFELYNLYPLLVHLNLFGSAYLADIVSTLDKYV